MADYLEGVGDLPVLPSHLVPGDIRRALPAAPPDGAESLDDALADFREIVLPGITHWNHPSFFAFFAITGSAPGILGEMIAAALNVNAMVWRSSPAATELEEVTLDWLRQLVGLPEAFEGTINDTASTSTMYALAAARERAYPTSRTEGLWGRRPGRVYASEHTHSSVEKSVLALGFGKVGYRPIPTDDAFRMRPDALRAALEEDVAAGIVPVAVVPTLGTTSTTSLDPVAEIVPIAREHGAWIHVDAAYGGPAAIVPELRPGFAGWEEADSIVINPHKWLFTPVDCSVLYCRHPELLVRAFSLIPAYLRMPEQGEVRNLMDYGVALGRRFRALKLWFVLRAFGREGIVARIRGHVELARELAALDRRRRRVGAGGSGTARPGGLPLGARGRRRGRGGSPERSDHRPGERLRGGVRRADPAERAAGHPLRDRQPQDRARTRRARLGAPARGRPRASDEDPAARLRASGSVRGAPPGAPRAT